MQRYSLLEGSFMKRVFMLLAMAGIYLWVRHKQRQLLDSTLRHDLAEATWASEGGANPAPAV
jgi:hypothetical protein